MRATIRIEPTEYIGEPRRKAFEKINSTLADVIPRADVIPAHYSITPRACSRSALRTYLIHIRAPIPFVVVSAHCATERRSLDTMHQRSHFRNRRCLARCRRHLGRAFALKPAEEASSITFPIGGCGSRPQRPLPDRPPTLQAFRSDLSRTHSVSTQQLINGSRSYPRCHGVQSRRTLVLYHKLSSVVYNGVQHLVFLLVWVHVSPSNRNFYNIL